MTCQVILQKTLRIEQELLMNAEKHVFKTWCTGISKLGGCLALLGKKSEI